MESRKRWTTLEAHSTHHSDAIVTEILRQPLISPSKVDSASGLCQYSTRFTDGDILA